MDMSTVTKQVASKLTSFGFPNNPYHSKPYRHETITPTLWVARIEGIVEGGHVYALVINKGHKPVEAHHVVDFRIGSNIYGRKTDA